MTVRDILYNEKRQQILIKALEQYATRCKVNATRRLFSDGKCSEREKQKQWAEEAEEATDLLNDLVIEMN
jgi:hypothetical protein